MSYRKSNTLRTIQQEVQIAANIADYVKEMIRGTPTENHKDNLIRLARMDEENQRMMAETISVEKTKVSMPHVSYNSGNNEWYTPGEYIKAAYRVMGVINLDPASSKLANATVKAGKYFTAEDNGLS